MILYLWNHLNKTFHKALTLSDVSIGLAKGSDVALSSSDFILMNNSLNSLYFIIYFSKKIKNNIKFNLFWAFIYNLIMIPEEELQLKALGERLRKYRLEKGFSQESFAEKTQLDRTYISGLERGKRNPSFLIIRRISKVLKISEQQLFESGDVE